MDIAEKIIRKYLEESSRSIGVTLLRGGTGFIDSRYTPKHPKTPPIAGPEIEIFIPGEFLSEYNIFVRKRQGSYIPEASELWEFFRKMMPSRGIKVYDKVDNLTLIDDILEDISPETHLAAYSWIDTSESGGRAEGLYIHVRDSRNGYSAGKILSEQ